MSSTYQPDLAPLADNLFVSALVAFLPLATIFVTLGVLRWKAHWAGLTAPVAFGAVATPIITAGALSGIDYQHIGAIVGRQTPILSVFIPLFLCILVDGKRGLKECWPIAFVIGLVFSLTKFVFSNYISVELTDIAAALMGVAATVIMLRVWKPKGTEEARERLFVERQKEDQEAGTQDIAGAETVAQETEERELTAGRTFMAL